MRGSYPVSRKRVGKMDKVGDLLIRIKNGYLASQKEVNVPYSKLALSICALLKSEGFIEDFQAAGREIKVLLKYTEGPNFIKSPALSGVKRISKPSRRIYKGKKSLPRVLNGLGIAIVSTPKGIMTDEQARKEGVGGELMAYVW